MIHDHPIYGFRMPRRAYRRLILGIPQKPHGEGRWSPLDVRRVGRIMAKVYGPAILQWLEDSALLLRFTRLSVEDSLQE